MGGGVVAEAAEPCIVLPAWGDAWATGERLAVRRGVPADSLGTPASFRPWHTACPGVVLSGQGSSKATSRWDTHLV